MFYSCRNILSRAAAVSVCVLFACSSLSCGQPQSGYKKNENLNSAQNATLKLTGPSSSFKSMESVIASFSAIYPNCTIEYEYVQDYDKSMTTRLEQNNDVDLFITNNITASSPFLPYALELKSQSDKLSLADTYEGLIKNFTLSGSQSGLYAIPLGGEVRGLYVNTTLLSSLGLTVPKNYQEWMTSCSELKKAGYIPLQGNPGSFAQLLLYPCICNIIANADDYSSVYNKVDQCQPGVSELFREPLSRLYDIVKNGYYNYKYVETNYGAFADMTNETTAKSFLNIADTGSGETEKKDNLSQVAYMPGTMSFKSYLDKVKDDYHSSVNYQFILTPSGDDGGFAYLSPSEGIAVNKNSSNTAWALEFLNYLFSKNVNKSFAEEQNIIPNTSDALDSIKSIFKTDGKHICQLGQVSFRYVFYDVMKGTLTDISKGNNPKYMKEDGTMYDLEYYMQKLEDSFSENRS